MQIALFFLLDRKRIFQKITTPETTEVDPTWVANPWQNLHSVSAKRRMRTAVAFTSFSLVLAIPICTSGQKVAARRKAYALATWSNLGCRAKGRFQDTGYCDSEVINQIVADGKSAIPVLISQITDSRWIAEPVYDFWPRIRAGELAYFILENLFLDDTWTKSTMPNLYPEQHCDEPAWVCWGRFRKSHSLADLQAHWMAFWKAHKDEIYWDEKARCFRLSSSKD